VSANFSFTPSAQALGFTLPLLVEHLRPKWALPQLLVNSKSLDSFKHGKFQTPNTKKDKKVSQYHSYLLFSFYVVLWNAWVAQPLVYLISELKVGGSNPPFHTRIEREMVENKREGE